MASFNGLIRHFDKNTLELRTEQEMIEGVRAKMLDAVRVRLQADVPVGIHLSGGIDSAVVAGMAKHLLDRGEVKLGSDGNHRLRCFGVAFDKGSGYDESGENLQHLCMKLFLHGYHSHRPEHCGLLGCRFPESTYE